MHPHINYIGIELYESVIVCALDKLIENDLPNLRLLNVNAKELTNILQREKSSVFT